MKWRTLGLALAATIMLMAPGARGDDKPADMGKCPVSGHPATADHVANFDGCKVYFCCDNCPKAFAKDPQKFAAKAHEQMVQNGQLKQTACPFTGKPLNPEQSITVDGVTVQFCCPNCKKKAEAMAHDDLVKAIFGDTTKGFKKAG